MKIISKQRVGFVMLLMTVMICLVTSIDSNAAIAESTIKYSGISGDLTWQIDSDGLLTITGIGDYDCGRDSVPSWHEYREEIKSAKVIATGLTSTYRMFYQCNRMKSVDLSGLDTSRVTDMSEMFNDCNFLEGIDVSNFDTSKVVDMSRMFAWCTALEKETLDLSSFNTSKVKNMSYMFYACEDLVAVNISKFNTSQVTDMSYMFYNCPQLREIDLSGFDTGKVTDMNSMFRGCECLEKLDVSNFNTSNVTSMSRMFTGCYALTELDVSGFDTHSVTDMNWMFTACRSLTFLDVSAFDTHNVKDMNSMFGGCRSLTFLDLSNFNTLHNPDVSDLIGECSNLVAIYVPKKCSTQFSDMLKQYLNGLSLVSQSDTIAVYAVPGKVKAEIKGTVLYANQLVTTNGIITDNTTFTVTSADASKPMVAFNGSADVNASAIPIPKNIIYNGVVYYVTTVSVSNFVDKAGNAKYKVTSNKVDNLTIEYSSQYKKNKNAKIPSSCTYKGIVFKVTSVGSKAFKNNKKVKTVTIADSIKKIGKDAFIGCKNLQKVTIGKGLTTIEKNAFKNCKKLKKIIIKSKALKKVGKNALKGIHAKCQIKAPKGKLNKYKKLFRKKGQKSTVKVVK